MTGKGEIIPTTRRMCHVCGHETEQYNYRGAWVCSECLFNPKSEYMRIAYKRPQGGSQNAYIFDGSYTYKELREEL